MKKATSLSLLAALAATGIALGAPAYTNPVGYVSQTCLPNSDTIVGVPLRQASAGAGALASAPGVNGNSATLTVSSNSFVASSFAGTHYIKFSSGVSNGKWFAVTANTQNSITVDLNGASVSAATADTFEVIKFWTLGELFNPAAATSDPATTPNAVVASINTVASGRRTQILIPNFSGAGINLAPTTVYYVHEGIWKKVGSGSTSFNNDQLWPDSYFIIRNPASVTAATTYSAAGEVDAKAFKIPLSTQPTAAQDNFIALPRPIDIRLSDLGLGGTSAFVESTNTVASGRRDQLLVFNNGLVAINKAPSSVYYYNEGIWKKVGGGATNVGSDIIPAGAGLIIRKYQSVTGATAEWSNNPTY